MAPPGNGPWTPGLLICTCFSIAPPPPCRLWNAINDPLFGWLSDTVHLPGWLWKDSPVGRTSYNPTTRRASAIRWGGLAWALAFLFVWFPWSGGAVTTGIHFTLALLAYDSALSFVEVNHGALLADMSHSEAERAGANAWSASLAAVGSFSSLVAYATWDIANLRRFQLFATALAVFSALVFWWSANVLSETPTDSGSSVPVPRPALHSAPSQPINSDADVLVNNLDIEAGDFAANSDIAGARARRIAPTNHDRLPAAATASIDGDDDEADEARPSPTFMSLMRQLASSANFRVFTVVSAAQTFDCHFEKNFFVPFMDALAVGAAITATASGTGAVASPGTGSAGGGATGWGSHLRAAIIALSFLLPHACTIAWTPLVRSRGLVSTIRAVCTSRLLLLALLWAATCAGWVGGGSGSGGGSSLVLWFMLGNRVLSESMCRLFPLVKADLVDQDAAAHKRVSARSSHLPHRLSPVARLPAGYVEIDHRLPPTLFTSPPIPPRAAPFHVRVNHGLI